MKRPNRKVHIACLRPEEDIDGMVNRADSALYESKDRGRNRITVTG